MSMAMVMGPTPPGTGVMAEQSGADFVERDVAGEAVAGFLAGVFDAVDADIDDDGTGFHPVRLDHFRAADRGDEDVRAAADGGQVP